MWYKTELMSNPTPQDYVEARRRCLHREMKYVDREQCYSFHPENCDGCGMIAHALAEQREWLMNEAKAVVDKCKRRALDEPTSVHTAAALGAELVYVTLAEAIRELTDA